MKKTEVPEKLISEKERLDFLKIVYQELSENSRYYDGHIWQIPSVTITVNAFLVGQAFSDSVKNAPMVRTLVVLSAAFFTFVLLIALVKHTLHRSAQDKNIEKIEKYMQLDEEMHHRYDLRIELQQVERRPGFVEKLLSPMRANVWLMYVMVVVFIADIFILAGIISRLW
jgi:preprotein translocase subunit SecG